jgi:hypothetical protein
MQQVSLLVPEEILCLESEEENVVAVGCGQFRHVYVALYLIEIR